jgi:hypothetical protein
VTFGSGDTSADPTVASLLSGSPRIAPAWANLNTGSRTLNLNTFPVQAIGFSGINDFKVRWIDVPETGGETCGSSNTFEVSLYNDGTGVDENATQPLNPANPIGHNEVPFDGQGKDPPICASIAPMLASRRGRTAVATSVFTTLTWT